MAIEENEVIQRKLAVEVVKDPRVLFAAERTMLAWVRTGLSLMGFGAVVAKFGIFLREMLVAQGRSAPPETGFSLWLGSSFVLLGIVANIIAVRQYLQWLKRINSGDTFFPAPTSPGVAISLMLAFVGALVLVYLFVVGR